RFLDAWAHGSGPGPRITDAAKKSFLDWATSVSPPLTDAEVEKLIPLLISNTDKTINQTLQSVQDGLVALRTKKLSADDATPGEEDTKSSAEAKPSVATGGVPPSGGTKAPAPKGGAAQKPAATPPKKRPPGKDAKKTSATPVAGAPAKKKPMSDDEKKIGEHVAAFLKTVSLVEGEAHWIIDDGAELTADPSGKASVTAWMYGRANGRTFMAHVTLHPTSHVGDVWSFHIDAGASIYDPSGTIVSTSNALDAKGRLSDK
ncbi:MAG: hypothetical protein JJD97_10930, partial [Gemmatimonadaceae bacterium]|nr:hypothetical protein [Gemmatimonadaceae bacterium]